jgi:hypothetical protein
MIEKGGFKSIVTEEESVQMDGSGKKAEGSSQKTDPTHSQQSHGDLWSEFRNSAKKVELPMFSGEDPAGWISRADVYF